LSYQAHRDLFQYSKDYRGSPSIGSSGHQARNYYSDQPIHTYYDDIEPGTFKHRNHLLDWISAKGEEPLRTEFVTATGTIPPG